MRQEEAPRFGVDKLLRTARIGYESAGDASPRCFEMGSLSAVAARMFVSPPHPAVQSAGEGASGDTQPQDTAPPFRAASLPRAPPRKTGTSAISASPRILNSNPPNPTLMTPCRPVVLNNAPIPQAPREPETYIPRQRSDPRFSARPQSSGSQTPR